MAKKEPVKVGPWPLGQDNRARDFDLAPEALRAAKNVDVSDTGRVRRRKGYTVAVAATEAHSMFSACGNALAVLDGNLCSLTFSGDILGAQTVVAGVGASPVAYAAINDDIYWSNGARQGVFAANGTAQPFGVEAPRSIPALTAGTAGSLLAGAYMVSVAFVDGEKLSAATPPATVSVQAGGDITVSAIPQPAGANVTGIDIFVSQANSEALYRRGRVLVGTTSWKMTDAMRPGPVCSTLGLKTVPPGSRLKYCRGRLLSVFGSVLVASRPLIYWLFDPVKDFFMFATLIRGLAAVEDGFFVSDENATYFIRIDEQAAARERVLNVPMISGSEAVFPNEDVSWLCELGMVIGKKGGAIELKTQDRLRIGRSNEADQGAALYMERDGISQVVTTVSDRPTSAAVAWDFVSAELRRA